MFERVLNGDGWNITPIPNPMPVPGDATPKSEATTGKPGAVSPYARADHEHPRLTSAGSVVLDANGDATVTFTRTFSAPPNMHYSYEEASNGQPIIIKRMGWVMTGGLYTGVTIHGYRLQRLPAVLTLLSALVNYDIAGGSAAGITVDVTALQKS